MLNVFLKTDVRSVKESCLIIMSLRLTNEYDYRSKAHFKIKFLSLPTTHLFFIVKSG